MFAPSFTSERVRAILVFFFFEHSVRQVVGDIRMLIDQKIMQVSTGFDDCSRVCRLFDSESCFEARKSILQYAERALNDTPRFGVSSRSNHL